MCNNIILKTEKYVRKNRKLKNTYKGAFNNYVDKMRGGGGQKMSVFVKAQGIKTVHAEEGGVKK